MGCLGCPADRALPPLARPNHRPFDEVVHWAAGNTQASARWRIAENPYDHTLSPGRLPGEMARCSNACCSQCACERPANRGLNDDWLQARVDYQAALDELRSDPDHQGPDLVAQQAASMELYQARFEFNVGNDPKAVSLLADAFVDANAISAHWRRRLSDGTTSWRVRLEREDRGVGA